VTERERERERERDRETERERETLLCTLTLDPPQAAVRKTPELLKVTTPSGETEIAGLTERVRECESRGERGHALMTVSSVSKRACLQAYLICTDAAYVLGFTYQAISLAHLKEMLGGLEGERDDCLTKHPHMYINIKICIYRYLHM
jgi:hypothetical protein